MSEPLRQPDVSILIKGMDLPEAAKCDLFTLMVQEDLKAPSMFTLGLYNWDTDKRQVTWSDDRLFEPGAEVQIRLGYVDLPTSMHRVMLGEITSLEPSFSIDELPTLTVRGYDHRHRLFRGRHTRSFTRQKDSAIARRIASAVGLKATVKDSRVTHDQVLQQNQTDMGFLQKRAARIGYEVFVQDKVLYFQPLQNATRETVSLSLDEIMEFSPRLTTATQVGEIVVRGYDFLEKEAIVGRAGAGQESSTMGGRVSGPRSVNRAFGKATFTNVTQLVQSKADADDMALGQFNEMALNYIEGECACSGRSDLHAGTVVKIDGLGKTFSGKYYVTEVIHSVSGDQGYDTRLRVRRNAS